MNIISIIIIITIINFCSSIDINYNKYRLKNLVLRIWVFKKKCSPQIFKNFRLFYDKCYDKSYVTICEGINDYNNNFTEEQKIIIETLISLCY